MPAEADRLFFALWPDPATRIALAASAAHLRHKLHPVGRWIDPQRYQLVLHFLGDYPALPEALIQRATEAAATVRVPRFALRIDQAGSLGQRDRPWWLAPSQPAAGLKQLWRSLREALQQHSVPYDTRLRLTPHVEVLGDTAQRLALTPVPAVDWPVDSFALIHRPPGEVSVDRLLESWPLVTDCRAASGPAQRDLWDT